GNCRRERYRAAARATRGLTGRFWRASVRKLLMEFPEPYHSLPISEWRREMKAHPRSYATIGVRAWLQNRHKWRLVCREDELYHTRKSEPREAHARLAQPAIP